MPRTLRPGWADGRVRWAETGPSWSETSPGPRGPSLAQPAAGGLGPPGLEMALRPLQLAVRAARDPGCPGRGVLAARGGGGGAHGGGGGAHGSADNDCGALKMPFWVLTE